MKNLMNTFKKRLKGGKPLLGIWNTIGGSTVPEMLADAGFDWVLVDCEHATIEIVEVLLALQGIASYTLPVPVVRPASNDPVLFKKDFGYGRAKHNGAFCAKQGRGRKGRCRNTL